MTSNSRTLSFFRSTANNHSCSFQHWLIYFCVPLPPICFLRLSFFLSFSFQLFVLLFRSLHLPYIFVCSGCIYAGPLSHFHTIWIYFEHCLVCSSLSSNTRTASTIHDSVQILLPYTRTWIGRRKRYINFIIIHWFSYSFTLFVEYSQLVFYLRIGLLQKNRSSSRYLLFFYQISFLFVHKNRIGKLYSKWYSTAFWKWLA